MPDEGLIARGLECHIRRLPFAGDGIDRMSLHTLSSARETSLALAQASEFSAASLDCLSTAVHAQRFPVRSRWLAPHGTMQKALHLEGLFIDES